MASMLVLPAPLGPVSATRSGPRMVRSSGPIRQSPRVITVRSIRSSSRDDGNRLDVKSMRNGVTISTRRRAAQLLVIALDLTALLIGPQRGGGFVERDQQVAVLLGQFERPAQAGVAIGKDREHAVLARIVGIHLRLAEADHRQIVAELRPFDPRHLGLIDYDQRKDGILARAQPDA